MKFNFRNKAFSRVDNSFYVVLAIHRKRRALIFKTHFSHFMTIKVV